MSVSLADPHLPEGDLVRLLDGELDAAERALTDVHVAACAECAGRMATLRRRSTRLSRLLQAADWEVPAALPPDELAPRRASRTPWLRTAAAILLLLGAGVAASPARAWITEWLGRQWAAITVDSEDFAATPSPAPAPPSPGPGTRVQFTPAEAEFTLELASRPSAGAVIVERTGGSQAVVEVLQGGDEAELLVLPAGVRVRNTPASTSDYRVRMPASVHTLRMRIAGGAPTVLRGDAIAAGTRVELR